MAPSGMISWFQTHCTCQPRRLDEIIVFRQLSKSEVKEIADIMLREVFRRAETKGITIDVTERFKVQLRWQSLAGSYVLSRGLVCSMRPGCYARPSGGMLVAPVP